MKNPKKSSSRSSAARKRSFPQRDQELIKIGELSLQGLSQYEIADKMGLSQPQICRDLKEYAKRLAVENDVDKEKMRARWMNKNRLIEKKLWNSFEKSTEDKEVQTKKQIAGGETDAGKTKERVEASLRSEGQCGNASFISEIGKCLEREAKMMGLYPATKLEHSGGDGEPMKVKIIEVVRPYPKPVATKAVKDDASAQTKSDDVKKVAAEQVILPISAELAEQAPLPAPEAPKRSGRIRMEVHLAEKPEVKLARDLAEFMDECGRQRFKLSPEEIERRKQEGRE